MAGPTQPQVTDEKWDDARIAGFLDISPEGEDPLDFRRLQRAYKAMRPEDFERFLKVFVDAGYNVNAEDHSGRTLSSIIARHRHGRPYIEALQQFGAETC